MEQADALLANAANFGLLPYFAIGFFAGLRSAELQRLDWSAINMTEGSIVVGAQVAKKRSRRVVEMVPVLRSWLEKIGGEEGPLLKDAEFRDNLEGLKKAAGIGDWPHNGLRHSFASYHLAFFGDAMKTATILGHKDPGVIHNHYKALVQKSEAEKFWRLVPGRKPTELGPAAQICQRNERTPGRDPDRARGVGAPDHRR
ncbi:MAG: tyrosine-type recombinase/integrase [Acidobacteria bacterium]|nr:tyrosine-type recombinase/integrase [Acidobacteriota bacterium]